jgi:hypothetical protein
LQFDELAFQQLEEANINIKAAAELSFMAKRGRSLTVEEREVNSNFKIRLG